MTGFHWDSMHLSWLAQASLVNTMPLP